jgi:hypothetical protein
MTRGFARSSARAASAHTATTASRSSVRRRRKSTRRASGLSAGSLSRELRSNPRRGKLRLPGPRLRRWPNSITRSAHPASKCPAENGAAPMIRRAGRLSSSAGNSHPRRPNHSKALGHARDARSEGAGNCDGLRRFLANTKFCILRLAKLAFRRCRHFYILRFDAAIAGTRRPQASLRFFSRSAKPSLAVR